MFVAKKAKSVEQITIALTNMISELVAAEDAALNGAEEASRRAEDAKKEQYGYEEEAAKAVNIRSNLQKLFN